MKLQMWWSRFGNRKCAAASDVRAGAYFLQNRSSHICKVSHISVSLRNPQIHQPSCQCTAGLLPIPHLWWTSAYPLPKEEGKVGFTSIHVIIIIPQSLSPGFGQRCYLVWRHNEKNIRRMILLIVVNLGMQDVLVVVMFLRNFSLSYKTSRRSCPQFLFSFSISVLSKRQVVVLVVGLYMISNWSLSFL